VKNDATPPSPNKSTSFEIIYEVTQGDDHLADDEEQGQIMGDV